MGHDPLIMEGSFEAFSIDEVLDVVGLSRQTLRVEFQDDDATTGEFLVKGGRLISAQAPPSADGKGAFVQLYRAHGDSFRVSRAQLPGNAVPIGTLADLIGEAKKVAAAPTPTAERSLVMQGDLGAFTLDEILEVLGISRQVMEVVFTRTDGTEGVIRSKAGRVLVAEVRAQGLSGKQAFEAIYGAPGAQFAVYQVRGAEVPEPLGALAELVAGAREAVKLAAAAAAGRRNVIMEGGFDGVSVDELFEVVGLSRQVLEVALYDGEKMRGAVLAKSGRVLRADALDGTEGTGAFVALVRNPGTRFVVFRRESAPDVVRFPLGSLAELMAQAKAPVAPAAPQEAADSVMLDASLAEFPFDEVIEVVGLTRQRVRVSLERHDGAAEIVVKAGRVLSVTAGSATGIEALQAIVSDPGIHVRVARLSDQPGDTPLGALADLLAAARAAAAPAEKPAPAPTEPPVSEAPAASPTRELVLEGSFDEYGIAEVLSVVGLSRQYLELAFRRDGRTIGQVLVKAGRIVAARSGRQQSDAAAALDDIVANPGTGFTLSRRDAPARKPKVVGMLADFAARFQVPEAAAPTPRPAPQAGQMSHDDVVETVVAPMASLALSQDPRIDDLVTRVVELEGQLAHARDQLRALEQRVAAASAAAPAPASPPVQDVGPAVEAALAAASGSDRLLLGAVMFGQLLTFLLVAILLASVLAS